MSQVPNIQNSDLKAFMKYFIRVSGAVSLILGVIFILSTIVFITSLIFTGDNNWFSLHQNNWLIVIFKLHAGIIDISVDPLHGIHLLDILILILFCLLCYGLYTVLKKSCKIWSLIAFSLSVVTIILFITTQNAGRSTVMLSVMIFSLVMLKGNIFNKVTIYAGILASVSLFVGDLTVGINLDFISIIFGIGYILLTTWFFLIGKKLFWLEVI